MGRGVARMGADRHFEGRACLVVLTLLRVKNGQIVVGLGQFRVVLGELLEHRDGFAAPVQFGEHDAF